MSYFVRDAFPAVLFPLSRNGRALGDFQLGYALWVLFGLTVLRLWRVRRVEAIGCVAMSVVVVVLLTPFSHTGDGIWAYVPALFRNTTGNWAMNRLYVPLAAMIVFAAASLANPKQGGTSGRRWLAGAVLCAACTWSLVEAGKFALGSREGVPPAASATDDLRPENVRITRFAYLVFPKWPASFTHGVTDPGLENRLRDDTTFEVKATNADAARDTSREIAVGQFRALPAAANYIQLDRSFPITKGHHYLLDVNFLRPTAEGVLQIIGKSFFREYGLPEYGGATSFGFGAHHSHLIPVWTTLDGGEDLILRYVPSPVPADMNTVAPFARVRLLEYDEAQLPVRVTSWIPYRAAVTSPEKMWVETPRMYQEAYRARVNGVEIPVVRSPEGLACIPVPAGFSQIELVYHPPAGLQALFWTSFAGILALGALASVNLRWPARPPLLAAS